MRSISLHIDCDMALPCAFVDRYMVSCVPVHALIYIFALRHCRAGIRNITTHTIATAFNILETDVINAWKHWEQEGLIRMEIREDNLFISFLPIPGEDSISVTSTAEDSQHLTDAPEENSTELEPLSFSESHTPEQPPAVVQPEQPPYSTQSVPESQPPEALSVVKNIVPASMPQYTVDELAFYQKQSADIERLFAHAEKAMAKMLTYHDLNLLFGFYDWLRLPVDVIMFLLTYCAERGNRDLRYVEKAAIDWAEHEISTVEKAREYTHSFDHNYRAVLQAFGQTGFPSPTQRKYIDKWMNEWEMSQELILEACDKCATNIGKAKLTYVDKIVDKWHKKGIRTLEAAKADTEDSAPAQKSIPETRKTGKSRFSNFKQREYDHSQIERMEREHLIKSLGEVANNGV